MTQTKDLRLVLKREQDIEQFNTAKAKAERELGYTLRDNEFAVRVLVQAVKPRINDDSLMWLVQNFDWSDDQYLSAAVYRSDVNEGRQVILYRTEEGPILRSEYLELKDKIDKD